MILWYPYTPHFPASRIRSTSVRCLCVKRDYNPFILSWVWDFWILRWCYVIFSSTQQSTSQKRKLVIFGKIRIKFPYPRSAPYLIQCHRHPLLHKVRKCFNFIACIICFFWNIVENFFPEHTFLSKSRDFFKWENFSRKQNFASITWKTFFEITETWGTFQFEQSANLDHIVR